MCGHLLQALDRLPDLLRHAIPVRRLEAPQVFSLSHQDTHELAASSPQTQALAIWAALFCDRCKEQHWELKATSHAMKFRLQMF